MTAADWAALGLTLKLASLSTVLLLLIGAPIAWWLARSRHRSVPWVEAVVSLPLVLPPTVLGFYLLIFLGPHGALGGFLEALGGAHLAFTFSGLVIGSVLYSLPFAVQPLRLGFAELAPESLEAAMLLGATRWQMLWRVVVPACRRALATAVTMSFAHTVGEFGVILMIGGNIPGETRVLSIALYQAVELADYDHAHRLAWVLLGFAVGVMVLIGQINRRRPWAAAPRRLHSAKG